MLSNITYYLLSQPEVLQKLNKELQAANIDPAKLSWTELEKIPYLYGVVFEGLRLSHGTSARSPRIARDEDLVYRAQHKAIEYVVPKGTPIGTSAYLVNTNEEVFPQPMEFEPGRWITEQGSNNHSLEKQMFSFSRGSRQCMGMKCVLSSLLTFVLSA